eukprot:TRINITY_DN16641_c1_g1_i1.p1 TRINITY_DN16641_c1_g1~~TRINITY_DN16641_c1_g1_i1.p1  ORF type:complete len:610 (-),score=150.18 TRINITY_DN16641_c1_g1_i1:100-1929(-)
MNRVISGYFDDAHRGLQRQQNGLSSSSSNVQLPPLRQDSPIPGGRDNGSLDKGVSGGYSAEGPSFQPLGSHSMGSLDFTKEQASRGVQIEQYQQALNETTKLAKKVRQLQDHLAITSAKKEAFRAQAQRLEKEFKKGREQSDILQKDLLEARREVGSYSKEAQEAMQMMTEMRKAHIQEVRLLQRGLAQRGGDKDMRNKVNEVADLVDKLGRAVLQRDEAIRDKSKTQASLTKTSNDLRAVSLDCTKLKRQNKSLSDQLKEALRKGKFVPPKPDGDTNEDSDEEFEHELQAFEQRFQILEEGPAGLDILASNLSKDKQILEKRLRSSQETNKNLESSVFNMKKLCEEKDFQIEDLNGQLDKMQKDHAALQEAIAQKRREIELQVAEEKAELERRINELELECDNARAVADGMEKASSRLTKELVKVHQDFAAPGDGGKAEAASKGDLLASSEQAAKTGESLKLEIYKNGDVTELHARESAGGELSVTPLNPALIKELDSVDPWTELFSRVGVSEGPPRRIVVSQMLGRKEVTVGGTEIILGIYRYDNRRFFVSGLDIGSQRLLDLPIKEDTITPELASAIDASSGNAAVFDTIAGALKLSADGAQLSLS